MAQVLSLSVQGPGRTRFSNLLRVDDYNLQETLGYRRSDFESLLRKEPRFPPRIMPLVVEIAICNRSFLLPLSDRTPSNFRSTRTRQRLSFLITAGTPTRVSAVFLASTYPPHVPPPPPDTYDRWDRSSFSERIEVPSGVFVSPTFRYIRRPKSFMLFSGPPLSWW